MHCQQDMRTTSLQEAQPSFQREAPLVLVVEDDPAAQDFMTRALAAEGISCVKASSVDTALEALQTRRMSATVLDWGLDRCGADVLNVAKELYPWMPVVAISGMPFEVRTDAVVNKADAFLNKPFSATVLTSQVKQLIGRAHQSPGIALPQKPQDILPLEAVQEIYIRHVVDLLEGNKSRAAEALGIHRQTVASALKETPPN
jgi:two-component system response regulator RegA